MVVLTVCEMMRRFRLSFSNSFPAGALLSRTKVHRTVDTHGFGHFQMPLKNEAFPLLWLFPADIVYA
jgi:hypothetical protein